MTARELRASLERAGVPAAGLKPLSDEFETGIYCLPVRGREAIATWRTLRERVAETGHWPVLLGDDESLDIHLETLEEFEQPGPGEVLAAAARVDAAAWFKKRWSGRVEEYWSEQPGEWPENAAPNDVFRIPRGSLGAAYPSLWLGLVPTRVPWEVPAHLHYGGWNACPQPAEHVALMRLWHERFGAELVGMAHDIVEMQVARPPAEREAAWDLACQQYLYCDDIVSQGVGDLQRLAAVLLNAPVWYFWWD